MREEKAKHRILVVEDDTMIQDVIKSLLTREGFEVVVSSDGKSGIESARKEKPDLIVLDINLPDMSGFEVCRNLKADTSTRHMPVIMLTGEAREVLERAKGLDVGAEDYMLKPFDSMVLVSRIRSLLKQATKPA